MPHFKVYAILFTLLCVSVVAEVNLLSADLPTPEIVGTQKSQEKASCDPNSPPMSQETKICQKTYPPIIEAKAGYFFFSSSTLRKIYKKGGLDLQLSGSYPIWKYLQVYGSVEYQARSGQLLNSSAKTHIWTLPVSFGLQPVVVICQKIHYYLTLGPRYIFVHQTNDSPYLDKIVTHSGVGGFANTGFHFFPIPHLVIDIFAEYSYKRMHFHGHRTNVVGQTIQVGGFAFGAGLGYNF